MTLVPNETEQALNRQHDVYAAAREEYRKKIAEQAAEIERLRAALEELLACPAIADGNHNDPAWACHETAAAETFARKVLARAALDGQPAPGKEVK